MQSCETSYFLERIDDIKEIINLKHFKFITKNGKNFFDKSHMNLNTSKNAIIKIFRNKKYGLVFNKENFE